MTPERRAMLDDPDAVGDDIAVPLGLDATDREVIRLLMKLNRSIRWVQGEHGLSDRQLYERLRLIEMGRVDGGNRAAYDPILAAYLALGGNAYDFGGWTPSDDYRRPARQPRSLPPLRRPAGLAWKKYRG